MGRLFDFAKFKANIVLLFRFGASFFQPKVFYTYVKIGLRISVKIDQIKVRYF